MPDPKGVRQALREGADEHQALIVASLVQVLDAEKDYYVTCRKCGTKTPTKMPDGTARVNAAKQLVELSIGRAKDEDPAQAKRDRAELARQKFAALTDEELAELAGVAGSASS